MPILLRLFAATSEPASHPSVEVDVPEDFSIVGGGAEVNWNGSDPGNLLVASFPVDGRKWRASSKDHAVPSPASLTAYAIAIENPGGKLWDVRIFTQSSPVSTRPIASVALDSGYTLTGGGALAEADGAGQLLTASFPSSSVSWEARSKDHLVPAQGRLTAFAIGVRGRNGQKFPPTRIFAGTSDIAPHPSLLESVDQGYVCTGGGARVNWADPQPGNLLWASAPHGQNAWFGASKDHVVSSPASISVFAIALRD